MVELLNAVFANGDLSKVKSIVYRDNGGIVVTPPRGFIKDLDILPMAWDLIDWPIYTYKPMDDSVLAIVSSSRGCTQQCSFCSQQLFLAKTVEGKKRREFCK